MQGWQELNLIHLLNFYLAAMFLLGTLLRYRQYEAVIGLVTAVPERWPRLFRLVKEHHMVMLSGRTLLPVGLALGLMAINAIASRVIWAHAEVTPSQLGSHLLAALPIAILGLGMISFDLVGAFWVGKVDRPVLEPYLDRAEYWLGSWVAPMVKTFTFGRINPRAMVSEEVRKALEQAGQLVSWTMWWLVTQTLLRVLFGLALWLTWALA